MNIYSYDRVTDFLHLHQVTCTPTYWPWWFRKHQPDLYNQIISQTDHLNPVNFTERLYLYTNGITQRPQCAKCTNPVTYNIGKKGFHTYCSQRCSMLDMGSLLGVENTSQLTSVKAKKKQSARAKYGVDNPSKAAEVQQIIREKAIKRWEPFWDGISHEGLYQYKEKVGALTDRNYRRYKDILDPQGLRSYQWHLDHIFSKSDGFRFNVDPELVAHPANLRIISGSANSSKNHRSDITLQVLMERIEEWNVQHRRVWDEIETKPRKIPTQQKTHKQLKGTFSHKGELNPNFGKKHSEEVRKIISEKVRAANDRNGPRVVSAETRAKISAKNKGKKRSAEICEQWSRMRKGRPGQDNNSGKHWYNDGVKNVLAKECPDGFVLGRLKCQS
jgi:endogenous inhibitor of DNA gyrase (YacG/DUF329 family)